jgi:hypothetical protein
MNARTYLARPLFALIVTLLAAAALPIGAVAQEATRHHLGLGLGYQRFVSDDLDDSGFEEAGLGTFAYRYSVSPAFDVAFDTRGTVSSQDGSIDIGGTDFDADVNYMTSWFGPGVRYNFKPAGTRPYVQANFYFVDERTEFDAGDVEVSTSENGIGFGFQAGMDIRLSRLLSLPIEANFMTGDPENDLTSAGFGVGLTFNFGGM